MSEFQIADWMLSTDDLENYLLGYQRRLANNKFPIIFTWSTRILTEINPNVSKTLGNKFIKCNLNYSEAKVAAAYCFWIAKLKPGFAVENTVQYINEYLGIAIGYSLIKEHLGLFVKFDNILIGLLETLRYHTSSPHMLCLLFEQLVTETRLKNENKNLQQQIKFQEK